MLRLLVVLFLVSAMFPPWRMMYGTNRIAPSDYGFIASPPRGASQVDFGRLSIEWVVLAVLGGVCYYGKGSPSKNNGASFLPEDDDAPIGRLKTQKLKMYVVWVFVAVVFCFIGAFLAINAKQICKILPMRFQTEKPAMAINSQDYLPADKQMPKVALAEIHLDGITRDNVNFGNEKPTRFAVLHFYNGSSWSVKEVVANLTDSAGTTRQFRFKGEVQPLTAGNLLGETGEFGMSQSSVPGLLAGGSHTLLYHWDFDVNISLVSAIGHSEDVFAADTSDPPENLDALLTGTAKQSHSLPDVSDILTSTDLGGSPSSGTKIIPSAIRDDPFAAPDGKWHPSR